MTELTEDQKTAIEVLCLYESKARMELYTNCQNEEYDRLMWMVVQVREELGLDICVHAQEAHARHQWTIEQAFKDALSKYQTH